jgi:2-keto-myo-inositol isomerase
MFAKGAERRRLFEAFAESCRWAQILACETVMSAVDAGGGEVQQAVAGIREAADIARAHGVTWAIEFLSQAAQLNNLGCMRELVTRAAHPNCGLLLDTYHFQRSGGEPESLRVLKPGEIVYVHYSDVPAQGGEPVSTLDRLPPGRGCVPFTEIFSILRDRSDGFLSYEAPNPAAWALPAERAAREALEATLARLPGGGDGSALGGPGTARPDPR